MAANLSLVMDDTDKVRAVLRRRDRATASRSCRPTSTRPSYRFEPVDAKRIRYGLGARQGHRRGGDRGDRRGARRGGAVHATCSISAAASTSAWSTGAWSRRWCAPARSTRSIRTARALLASVGPRARGGRAGRAQAVAEQPVRRSRGAARRRARLRRAPRVGRAPEAAARRRRRSASTSPGHLFSVYARELARFPRTPLAKLSRERARLDGRRGGLRRARR